MVKVISNLVKDMSMAFTKTTQNNDNHTNNLVQAFKDTKIVHKYLLNGFVIGQDWLCA